MKTIIGIQDEYIRAVLAGAARWAHRPGWGTGSRRFGGHFPRICRGAHAKALAALKALGFTGEAAEQAIAQAWDVARLEMDAE